MVPSGVVLRFGNAALEDEKAEAVIYRVAVAVPPLLK
jgi:hypothetical protein